MSDVGHGRPEMEMDDLLHEVLPHLRIDALPTDYSAVVNIGDIWRFEK
jgi:hypothetical protein